MIENEFLKDIMIESENINDQNIWYLQNSNIKLKYILFSDVLAF